MSDDDIKWIRDTLGRIEKNVGEAFGKLDEHGQRIAVVETKAKSTLYTSIVAGILMAATFVVAILKKL